MDALTQLALRAQRDPQALLQLLQECQGLLHRLIYQHLPPSSPLVEELESVGEEAVLLSCRGFRGDREVQFATYLWAVAHSLLHRELSFHSNLTAEPQELAARSLLRATEEQLQQELLRPVTGAELAARLGWLEERVVYLQGLSVWPLELEKERTYEEEEYTVEVPDRTSLTPEQEVLYQEAIQEEVVALEEPPGFAAFGEYLRGTCPRPNIREIARRCHVGPKTVYSWWRGARQPQYLDDLREIAQVIDRPLEELIAVFRRKGNTSLPEGE